MKTTNPNKPAVAKKKRARTGTAFIERLAALLDAEELALLIKLVEARDAAVRAGADLQRKLHVCVCGFQSNHEGNFKRHACFPRVF